MSPLHELRIALVSVGAAGATTRRQALEDAGAEVSVCGPVHDLQLVLGGRAHHLLLVHDLGDELPAATVLRSVDGLGAAGELPRLLLVTAAERQRLAALANRGGALLLDAEIAAELLVGTVAAICRGSRALLRAEGRTQALEEELRARARRIEQQNRRIEVLEHEVRTPLTIIVGFACNLRDEVDGPLLPEQKRRAGRIVEAALAASGLLTGAVEEARRTQEIEGAQAAGVELPPTRRPQRLHLDLGELVRSAVALFDDEAGRAGVRLTVALENAVHVWCDPLKLKQVVTNLVANALKFTPAGGQIACRVRLGAAEAQSGRRQAEVVVEDSGPGVPEEAREHIFEPGVRLERDTAVPGRGLGLAVCRDIVRQHQGRLWVEAASAMGGAAFRVTLPIDLRTRQTASVVFVRQPRTDALGRALQQLCADDPSHFSLVDDGAAELSSHPAQTCEAVALVPSDTAPSRLVIALKERSHS